MNVIKLRDLFESRSKETNGRWRFLTEMRQGLGLCDKDGNENRDFAGNLVLKDRALRPENFSLQELAEAIIGPSWRQLFSWWSGRGQDSGSFPEPCLDCRPSDAC